ncbi:protein toll [Colletes gigas]|uniref:protein toll n=1 Tax=Colletes gigas TaxID=935657 RepID=UPI001C9B5F2E|nr:protein toll [Colletes gigas]XP_043249023.1 protein toll [Colletes gigas]
MVRGKVDQWWIILPIVILASNAFEIQCPERSCSCYPSHNRDTELHCPTGNDSAFIVNVDAYEYIQIQCRNSPEWSDFHLSNLFPAHDIQSVHFRMCDLPSNTSLGEIANRLGATNVERLIFQKFDNLNTNLTREHLKGFPKLKNLILSTNNIGVVSDDLFADMPMLIWLDLRDNNVHLPPGIFRNISKLKVLELGRNMMRTIEPGIFDQLSDLRLLNLWQNKFTEIEPGTFDKLVSLKSLDINTNELITLPKDIFAKLENLEVLNLFGNNFTSLPGDLLRHNNKLKTVLLYGNKKNMTTFPEGLFANLTELMAVQLRSNGLKILPENLFWGSVSLNNISLERNYLESLPKDIFKGLNKLLRLELSYNELTSLPDDVFSHTTSLIKLDLSKNHIRSISRHLFKRLKSLQVLNMKENQLQVIEDTSFNNLEHLKIAIFSNNQLSFNNSLALYHDEYGKKSPFQACTSLKELHLANNNITEIFGDWIISSLNLRLLDLKYNRISYISTEDLQFISNNIKVDLTHNNIKHINLNTAEKVAGFQTLTRDVIILVEDNPIACDCDMYNFLRYLEGDMNPSVQNYFHIVPGNLVCQSPKWIENVPVANLKSKSLKCEVLHPCPKLCTCWVKPYEKAFSIDCSYKNLTNVPSNIKTLPTYKVELNLTGNELNRMLPLAEIGLKNASISKLLLSNTNISSISLNELPLHVEVLELHNNNISKMDSKVLQFMSNSSTLKTLTLHGNPWICDCNARDFLNFVQTKVEDILDPSLITCKDMNIPMLKMTATDFCPTDIIMIIGISLAIALTGLIIGLLAALYYRYQREIKVWLYAHQLCLWLVTEDELDKDKLYDAFISYSHKDEDFVVNELVSKLESGPRPFKLCLHFRDWVAGEWIPTQIARSVDVSKRTIVILSPNFLESVWGRMEFRAAHSQALSEGRARVILILYGEIGPTDDLDPELKAYLSMNTYVKWGDPWFWDKLRYALPHSPELTKNTRRKIFEEHQPSIQINDDKKELIYPVGAPETPPAASTPPADTLKIFMDDEKNDVKKDDPKKLAESNGNAKLIFSPEELKKNNLINKIQCTTV